ncbi:MAG: PmoA family protein [Saprospiraceae bacterium]|nr:PmoA family protein [Saprospiraceae bacterium]
MKKKILAIYSSLIVLGCTTAPSITKQIDRDYQKDELIELEINYTDSEINVLQINEKNFPNPLPLQKINNNKWVFRSPQAVSRGTILSINQSEVKFPIICQISEDDEFVTAQIGNQEILKYAISVQNPPDSLPTYYSRSGFIHPLKTMKGQTLTAGFPKGHVHQHGIFHAWTRTHVRDSMIDFWNQQARLGDIRHKELLAINHGPVFSEFKVLLEYLAFIGDDTLITSHETWGIRIFPLAGQYVLDWNIQQENISPDTLKIDEYHYGGAAFRGSESWNVEGGAYDSLVFVKTAEGKNATTGNHSRPKWITIHGVTEAGYGGIAMIQHPLNFRYPQPVRIHPTMPYVCFAPMVIGSFDLAPEEVYTANFRILIFDGKPDENEIEKYAQTYQME